jgi:hypothetical protein
VSCGCLLGGLGYEGSGVVYVEQASVVEEYSCSFPDLGVAYTLICFDLVSSTVACEVGCWWVPWMVVSIRV